MATINKLIPAAALGLAGLAVAVPAMAANDKAPKGEAELAKLLEGRVAGEPIHCLSEVQRRNMQVVDRTALVFKDGDTYYVNRPSGVDFLTWSDVPVFRIWGNQLCDKDTAQLRDSSTWMPGPVMVMGDFVPYHRKG